MFDDFFCSYAVEDDGDGDDDGGGGGSDPRADEGLCVLAAARSFGSGRAAATAVAGDGRLRAACEAKPLAWAAAVERMGAATDASERREYARAIGTLAQVVAYGDPMREAGVVDAMASWLRDDDEEVAIAAADAIRHLACASQGNRIRAREAGAIPRLVAMLGRVAELATGDACGGSSGEGLLGRLDASAVRAATAALRNLSFQNGPNRDEIRFSGGLAPLLQIVAQGDPPRPPPSGTPRREAAYRAAGALENLAADNEENAEAIVRAAVVPAMKELLLGTQAIDLSQRAAREGRKALFALMARHKARARAEAEAETAAAAAAAAATAACKARLLGEIEGRRSGGGGDEDGGGGDEGGGGGDEGGGGGGDEGGGDESAALTRRVGFGLVESQLGGLSREAGWAHAVVAFAAELDRVASARPGAAPAAVAPRAVPPPPPLLRLGGDAEGESKALRTAIYRVVARPPLGDLVQCRTDAEGNIAVTAR